MKYMNRITLCVSLCMLALFCSCDEERDIRWTTVEIVVRDYTIVLMKLR